MTGPRLHLSCSDLNPGCEAELTGEAPDELVVQYARHSSVCTHAVRHVDLDDLLGAVTWVPVSADRRWTAGSQAGAQLAAPTVRRLRDLAALPG